MTEEGDKTIDQYLNGELPDGERTAFSRRLGNDETLRQRVILRQQLTDYLGSDEADLVDFLAKADQEHYGTAGAKDETTSSSRTKWWLLAIAFCVGGFLCWWFFADGEKEGPAPSLIVEKASPSPVFQDTIDRFSPEDSLSSAPPTAPAPAAAPVEKTTPPPVSTPKPELENIVFAQLDPADFTPNPMLEDMLGGELRSAVDSTSLLLVPARDTLVLADIETATLQGYTTIGPPYDLLVFDNREEHFIEDRPVMRQRIEGSSVGDGFSFTVALSSLTKRGKYYVLVFNEGGELLDGEVVLIR